jgi:threonine/homoserine/homoserine lactone efflux protein
MDIGFFLRGLIIGFSIAAPVGPIGVLCIRRTLVHGRTSGLISGLGAATADAIYGSVAGFGLTVVSDLLIFHRTWLRLAGGVFLFCLGLKTYLSRPAEQPALARGNNLIRAYTSTFFLTLTNPITIFAFAAIFAALGVGGGRENYLSAGILVLGVFAGSALWWLILSCSVGMFRTRFSTRRLRWVNRISGILLMTFGVFALLSLMG